MILNVKDGIFEINTSESYNKDIYVVNDNIIVPYINIEIFKLNFSSILKNDDKLNFSYLIFTGVKEVLWKYEFNDNVICNNLVIDDFSDENYLVDYIEATNIFCKYCGYDFEIRYKEEYLYFSDDVKVKNGALNFWIPFDTPNFKRNMDEKDVELFFNIANVPFEALEFINVTDRSALKILDLTLSV